MKKINLGPKTARYRLLEALLTLRLNLGLALKNFKLECETI